MNKFKEVSSGVYAFVAMVCGALFLWLTPKEVVGYVFLSLLVLTGISLFWRLLTMIIDDLRGK